MGTIITLLGAAAIFGIFAIVLRILALPFQWLFKPQPRPRKDVVGIMPDSGADADGE